MKKLLCLFLSISIFLTSCARSSTEKVQSTIMSEIQSTSVTTQVETSSSDTSSSQTRSEERRVGKEC